MGENGKVEIEKSDEIVRILFQHPKANSLPAALLDQLTEAVREASAFKSVRAIGLESRGKTYCAGASFEEFERLSTLEEAERFFSRFATLFITLKDSSKWIVTKVQGKAVGGGVGLLSAADYSIGCERTAACLSEYALDIGPYVIGPVVSRRCGSAAFAAMALDCEWRTAQWCLEHGLLSDFAEGEEGLQQRYESRLESLATRSLLAGASLKRACWEDAGDWQQLLYAKARVSAELLMARKALEKDSAQ